MQTLEEQFNTPVSVFLGRTGLRPTTLGMRAVGDPSLLRQIERGRSPSLRTADRVLAFIGTYEWDSDGARARPARGRRPRRMPPTERRSRRGAMTRTTEGQENEAADSFPADLGGAGPDGPGAEHDLPVVGRGALPPASPPECARGTLGRGRSGRMDLRADHGERERRRGCRPLTPGRERRGR